MHDGAVALAPAGRRPLPQRIAVAAVHRWLMAWRVGSLVVELPDGSSWEVGDRRSADRVTLTVRDWAFFPRVLAHSDVGLGESYMAGEWHCDDLVGFVRLLLQHRSIARRPGLLALPSRVARRWRRRRSGRHAAETVRDVQAHYDIGNELFASFLDETMTYSAAVFPTPTTTLEEAQRHKLDGICRRLDLAPGLDVLDIGGGWGSFAIHAARTYGCRVRSITLSAAQHALARDRVRAAGLEALVDVQLGDYRDVSGRYDRIVSVEMFEAIGWEQYGLFFRTCERALRPDGRMFLQTSVYPDREFHAYRSDVDWIRKHVFPGGLLASLRGIRDALERETRLRVAWMEDIGPHYASTLRCWRERYLRQLPVLRSRRFDASFLRKWDLYLAMCEAAFAVGHLGTLQLLIVPTQTPPAISPS